MPPHTKDKAPRERGGGQGGEKAWPPGRGHMSCLRAPRGLHEGQTQHCQVTTPHPVITPFSALPVMQAPLRGNLLAPPLQQRGPQSPGPAAKQTSPSGPPGASLFSSRLSPLRTEQLDHTHRGCSRPCGLCRASLQTPSSPSSPLPSCSASTMSFENWFKGVVLAETACSTPSCPIHPQQDGS